MTMVDPPWPRNQHSVRKHRRTLGKSSIVKICMTSLEIALHIAIFDRWRFVQKTNPSWLLQQIQEGRQDPSSKLKTDQSWTIILLHIWDNMLCKNGAGQKSYKSEAKCCIQCWGLGSIDTHLFSIHGLGQWTQHGNPKSVVRMFLLLYCRTGHFILEFCQKS